MYIYQQHILICYKLYKLFQRLAHLFYAGSNIVVKGDRKHAFRKPFVKALSQFARNKIVGFTFHVFRI